MSDQLNESLLQDLDERWRWPSSSPVFEVLSCLASVADVRYVGNEVRIGKKTLLSGAAGGRARRRIGARDDASGEARLDAEFFRRREDGFVPIPVCASIDDTIPFAVDMRNGFNFYHFLTETLPQVSIISRHESVAPIFIHLPDAKALRSFPMDFITAIYPDLASRIRFTSSRRTYDRVNAVFNHRHYLYQIPQENLETDLCGIDRADPWHHLNSGRKSRKFVMKSSVDTGMRLLRDDAIERLDASKATGLPKKVWIGRDTSFGKSRDRTNRGEAEMLEALQGRGFENIFMENLSPLEQVAIWHGADVIVAPHGAGLANMMFAHDSAEVVEVGTPQTLRHRWGDFLGNAHVARCRYTTVFADVNGDLRHSAAPVASIKDGLHGIDLGIVAINAVMARVDAAERLVSQQNKSDAV